MKLSGYAPVAMSFLRSSQHSPDSIRACTTIAKRCILKHSSVYWHQTLHSD